MDGGVKEDRNAKEGRDAKEHRNAKEGRDTKEKRRPRVSIVSDTHCPAVHILGT